jgi:hypothetical protein
MEETAMTAQSDQAFDDVSTELQGDPDDDVTRTDDSLAVAGRVFALLENSRLLADLPKARASDLIARGIATTAHGPSAPLGVWISVRTVEDWSEIAREAHEFVGEHPVGGES